MEQQTWKIKGQVYTHAQLMELKRKGLDPRKDKIIMKFITPRNTEEDEVEVETETETEPQAPETVVEPAEEGELPPPPAEAPEPQAPADSPEAPAEEPKLETEAEELARMKEERAWLNPKTKDRYKELNDKAKSAKQAK